MSDDVAKLPEVDPTPPPAHVTVAAASQLSALRDAMAMRGRLCDDAFKVHGYSGKKIRYLFNNLMSEVFEPRYLEIGVFHGASLCSAIFENVVRVVAIDDWTWSNDKSARDTLDANIAKFRTANSEIKIIDSDFRAVDYSAIGPFNVMYYDGPHDEQDQNDGVAFPLKAMDELFILIVDDWNWFHVRRATFKALLDGMAKIEYSVEIRTTMDDSSPLFSGSDSEWHNGLLCAVVSKSKAS